MMLCRLGFAAFWLVMMSGAMALDDRGADDAEVFVLPDGSRIPLLDGTSLLDCGQTWRFARNAEPSAAPVCVLTPWRLNQEALYAYITSLYQSGFASDGRDARAIWFCKDGRRLTLTAIPVEEPDGDDWPPGTDLIFLFIPEPEVKCSVSR